MVALFDICKLSVDLLQYSNIALTCDRSIQGVVLMLATQRQKSSAKGSANDNPQQSKIFCGIDFSIFFGWKKEIRSVFSADYYDDRVSIQSAASGKTFGVTVIEDLHFTEDPNVSLLSFHSRSYSSLSISIKYHASF